MDAKARSAELPLQPGQIFHGLEILELLGRGGMGVVFKARQRALDRLVAVKILPADLALDPDFQNRFIREAKAMAALSHPNIITIYDFGAESGLFFFVMEFVDGVSLRQRMRDARLPGEQALAIVPQLCDALEYAHGEGIVHRDIKPENILLDRRGRVKIADFGLAKLVASDERMPALTQSNMVMGTAHYMAPEQVENPKAVDHRADLYALGVVLYEMLTGELPLGKFEPPSKRAAVDARLDDVILRTLERNPGRRYQSASAIRNEISRVTGAGSMDAYAPTIMTPPPKARKVPAWMAVAALAAVLLAAAALWPRGSRPPEPPPAPPVNFERLYFAAGERPAGRDWFPAPAPIPRNPFPAKDPQSLEILVKFMDGMDLKNVAPGDIREGYLAMWYGAGVLMLDTPLAERLERDFAAAKGYANAWTHRNGSLLALVYSGRANARAVFEDVVARTQDKLGLPREMPDVALQNLNVERGWLPDGWEAVTLERDVELPVWAESDDDRRRLTRHLDPAAFTASDFTRAYYAAFQPESGPIILHVAAFQAPSAGAVGALETKIRATEPWKSAVKVETLRKGRTIALLSLQAGRYGAFEKVAETVRVAMGYPERTFEQVVPSEPELPPGFSVRARKTDPREILRTLNLERVRPSDVTNAYWAELAPQGAIVVLEAKASTPSYELENLLRPWGTVIRRDNFVCAAQAPDEESAWVLSNRLREKVGWEPRTKD